VNDTPTSSYLGAANMVRLQKIYAAAGTDKDALKTKQNEMMVGDPFVDLKP